MCAPNFSPWVRPAPWENTTRVAEFGRLIVTNGNTHCPAEELCDINFAAGETYETYVRRHAVDHGIYIDADFQTIERNLYLWCFYSFLKSGLENPAITSKPFWAACEFLSNWEWDEEDLEMHLLAPEKKAQRSYEIKPLHLRKPGSYRRQKKFEAPRETLKTVLGFADATWEHLRQYFIFDNVNFRITVHSSTTKLTRKRYINFAVRVWGRKTGKLFELFGGEEEYGPEERKKVRKIGLIKTRGAVNRIDNLISLRWLQDAPHAFATHSMMGLGADSESTGERWDKYIGDDVCTGDNSDKFEKRQRVKIKVAEQEKQGEHGGHWLWIDTRKHLNDVSGDVDREQKEFFHIMHRKATWPCIRCGKPEYYWIEDGLGKPRITETWLAEQRRKHKTRDFWNELMNEPQDPDQQHFKPEWFHRVPLNSNVPLEIRCGLGIFNSQEERLRYEQELEILNQEGRRIFAINLGDPAGSEKISKKGDRTAIVGLRWDRACRPWITLLRSGQWGAQLQKEMALEASLYNKPTTFIWEIVQDIGVDKAWSDFRMEKSRGLPGLVHLPMEFRKPKRVSSKEQRIDELEPYFRNGVYILESAGTAEEIELFISQFLEYRISDHDDYPDAVANAIDYMKTLPMPAALIAGEEPLVTINEAGNPMVAIGAMIQKMKQPKEASSWARSGGVR